MIITNEEISQELILPYFITYSFVLFSFKSSNRKLNLMTRKIMEKQHWEVSPYNTF